jgi:hypothetical protein
LQAKATTWPTGCREYHGINVNPATIEAVKPLQDKGPALP